MSTGQVIQPTRELDELENQVIAAAKRTVDALRTLLSEAEPLHAFSQMKFEPFGFHPADDRSFNLIEQINQNVYLSCIRSRDAMAFPAPSRCCSLSTKSRISANCIFLKLRIVE